MSCGWNGPQIGGAWTLWALVKALVLSSRVGDWIGLVLEAGAQRSERSSDHFNPPPVFSDSSEKFGPASAQSWIVRRSPSATSAVDIQSLAKRVRYKVMDQNTPSPTEQQDDNDNTPRSELPSLAVTPTPARDDSPRSSEDGYFALKPTAARPNSLLSPAAAAIAISPSLRRTTTRPDTPDRPVVQRDLSHASVASVESNLSTVTVKASDSGHGSSSTATSPLYTRPKYPNQAFSALQQQRYPPPHLPPTLRTKTHHPAQPSDFRQAINALHKTGARSADNTPAATPGLFTPSIPAEQSNLGPDEHGFYASPFLHFTHRQAPKETHIADVDIDPISGRKLINNYEIIDELGRGTHGKVKLGRNLATNEYVAIKIVERYSKKRRLGKLGNAEDKVKKEVAILKKARHPNIVALLEVIDDPARKKVYIVLERVELGEIVWRASAPKEVALVECRRYIRESRGVFDDEEAEAEDRAILDEAKTRRLKQQRRTLRKLRRQRMAGGSGAGWSFEFGGDTDEDDSDADHASRVSTSTTEKSADQGGVDSRQLTAVLAQFSVGDSDGADPGTPVNPANHQTFWQETSPVKLLEGTMYGSYEEELADKEAARAPSLASSVRSFGAQDLRHPEERKFWDASGAEILDADLHPDLQFVPCMSMNAARVAFRDTVLGLQYLHYQGIIHRDIKPPNLLQTADHRTKISDFGVSYLGRPINDDQVPENLSESDMQDFDEAKELAKTVGTAAFYAPELCYTDGITETPPVGPAIDVWALGITLFCMLFGRTPFVDNEFVVMRRIADEEIYVPRRRLRPVDPRPKSRPSSHGRYFPPAASGKRSEYDLAYEELDDLLLDLFRRLLQKDPLKRITLEEVRHHPWVVQDISNKPLWLDETDPSRQSHGKKIQVSKEELQDAVVPVKLVERIRSGVKKTIGGLMSGLGRASSTKTRTPSMSGSHPLSTSSSSSAVSQEGRRNSLRGDESIFSALKASREMEHPLAQSVTVSPEQAPNRDAYFSRSSTPNGATDYPSQGDRSRSIMSTTTSVRTIKPADILNKQTTPESPPTSPGLGSSSFDSTVTNIGGLLSGAGRRILKSVRDRSTAGRGADGLERSTSRAPSESSDAHADPSVAVSNTQASGLLDLPDVLKNISPAISISSSPMISRSQSRAAPERRDTAIRPSTTLSRQVSTSSFEARRRLDSDSAWDPDHSDRLPNESSEYDFRRAEDEWLRRSTRESSDETRVAPSRARTEVPDTCPPSPDDDFGIEYKDDDDDEDDDDDDDELVIGGSRADARRRSAYVHGSQATSPTSRASGVQPLMTPSSSEDRFPPNTPMSCSNPSIPSFTTIDSEAPQEKAADDRGELLDPLETPFTPCVPVLEDDGYSGDNAIESDEDDYEDSSDDDGGLQMVRRRSAPFTPSGGRGLGVSSTSYFPRHSRRGTGSSALSKKSSRSGSNNTMKKIRSHDESD
ncbi:kinase-like protein [Aureobasidium subglaciale]|nr:kinase-like protein [Aureobasidium subglaciale]